MKLNSKSGATLAAAAATLFLAGAVVSTVSTPANAAGKCMAGNACKGQSACKGSANSCKGQNACKGQGFSAASESSAPPWAPSTSRVDPSDRQRGLGVAGPSLFRPRCFDPIAKMTPRPKIKSAGRVTRSRPTA